MIANTSDSKYAWLDEAIAKNTPGDTQVVTASRRLARELRAAYDQKQTVAGRIAWQTPSIEFWQDWLAAQAAAADQTDNYPRRLDSLSGAILWEQSLRKQMPDGLLNVGGIVRQASLAWRRLHDWAISPTEVETTARNQDERMFARAAANYRSQLSEGAWIDNAGLASQVALLIDAGSIAIPKRLVVAGFDRLSPSVKRVMELLVAAGTAVEVVPPPRRDSSISIAAFDREDSEMRAAGAWAREYLAGSPDAKVAIVCPELEADAAGIARMVREGFAPGWQYGGSQYRAAVNVSYGRRMSEYPAISIALMLLRWISRGLTSRELSTLLRSKCVASDDLGGRSRLELRLRRYPDREWSTENLLQALSGSDGAPDSVAFIECVRVVAQFAQQADEKMRPADCVHRIDAFLKEVRWPGTATLDSAEFQLVNRWRELLNELARVEAVTPQLRLSQAIGHLATLASETVWQPETEPGMVQVLGTLEASGMEFDGIWISGLDAAHWPPASRPSPFISHALQRKYEMPDATPGDTLENSKIVLQRLIGAADQCVVSWSRIRGDAELAASPLLDHIDAVPYSGPADPGWYALNLAGDHTDTEKSADNAPEVLKDERIGGGAYTVQRQYVEPFSAFVYGRLGVRPPEFITIGLGSSVRGNIIHNALHNLLAGRPPRDAIGAWTGEQRVQRIGSAVDAALAEHTAHADDVISRIIGLERRRLQKILHDFLDAEVQRSEFSVADVEKQVNYDKCSIRLGLRIDRIDRLADGRVLVIDYKTGIPKHFMKKDGELTDVQLVVYADALGEDIGGLVLINVDSREIGYKGTGDGWLDSDDEDWPRTFESWRDEVHAALRALAAGDVRINIRQTSGEGRPLNILSRLEEQKRAD